MSFAGDDCAGGAKLLDEPGIARGHSVQVAIEVDAATGGRAGKVEAIFDGNGQSPERAAAIAEVAAVPRGMASSAFGFGAGPGGVLPEIGVAAGIPVGLRECLIGQSGRLQHSRMPERGEGRGQSTGSWS